MLLRIATMEHRSRRGERLERRNTTRRTLLPATVIPPSCGLFIPFLTSMHNHRRHGCMNGKTPEFYNLLVGEWQTTSAWTGLTWQQYKVSCLGQEAWMSCPSPSTTPRPKWASFLSTIELVLYELFVWTICIWTCIWTICIWTINSLMHT
jgi:hypothetical protein